MKSKTLSIIASVLILISSDALAQERTSKSLPKIGSEIKGQLIKATGWLLNPEAQWVSRQNRIPVFLDNKSKILIDYEKYSVGLDNFISYQLRDIKIQDSTYSILIKKYNWGQYRYSAIEQDWMTLTNVIFYVFQKSEMAKLKNIKQDSINLIKINILYSSDIILWINNGTYLSDIENEIVKQIGEEKTEKENYLVLHIAPYKSKKIVQFQIYYSYDKYKTLGGILGEHKIDIGGEYSWDKKQIYLTNDLFKYCYFETDYTSFNNFLKIDN
ncbi:MAG: hypothetical protein HGB12_13910 [Bacteroidetes bacterium]|nr:hypothetical protein [Bacteroidota bacterium]